MIRLRHFLLASALVPALLATGPTPGMSQTPDKGEHHPRRQQDGGHGGEGRPHAQNREERAPQRDTGKGERREGSRAGGREERHDDRRPGGEPHRDEKRLGNDQRRDDRRPAGEQHRDEKRLGTEQRREEKRPVGDQRREEKRLGNEERRDEKRLGNEQRRDEKRLGHEGPGDERRPVGEQRRDERRLGDGERRDERRPVGEQRRDERRLGNEDRRGPSPAGGFAGGFLPPTSARRLDDLRRDRREVREGDRAFIREPGRTIVEERGRSFIVHDETDRFRALGLDVRRERRGDQFVDTIQRPNGDVIITITDGSGRMLRRLRRDRGGREVILIDNGVGGRIRPFVEDVVVLPPPPMRIPRERYIVDYRDAAPALIYDTLVAPPLAPPPQRYTLDQIRYSPDIRSYVRQVDINTINFESGSWEVPAAASGKLEALASGIKRAIDRNPNSVFLIEGYTDATGNPNDNLSLSDRRAQSVAEILTKDFAVPPENLTTQGYGQQNPKEDTQGPSAANRRVVVQNITQLLASGGAPAEH